jgi:hypothetical protein
MLQSSKLREIEISVRNVGLENLNKVYEIVI